MTAAPCLLTCELVPAQLPVGQRTTLTFTARNRTKETLRLKRLTLTLLRGDGAEHLLPRDAKAASVDLGYDGKEWSPVREDLTSPHAAVEIGIEHSYDAMELRENDSVSFTFTCTANDRPGPTKATISETTDKERTGSCPLSKTPKGFRLANLRPRPHVVEAGHRLDITWETVRQPPTVTYDLAYTKNGQTLHEDVSATTTFTLWPFEDTNVTLTATIPADPPTPRIEAALTCFAIVTRPWLKAVSLKAVRQMDTLGSPHGPGPVPGYGRREAERRNPVKDQTFSAETDGILTVNAEASDRSFPVTVHVQLRCEGTRSWTLTTEEPRNLTVPVPAGAPVVLNATTSDPKSQAAYLLALDWRPLGAGQIIPQ
ncbi:hypothetical protein [Streptomyces sp. enrichment culture]|uniref:hypothetical protein n=1 Tax=Streptomyces sp. enrichment culture TaxID=1795815 RepID=UPI003F576202